MRKLLRLSVCNSGEFALYYSYEHLQDPQHTDCQSLPYGAWTPRQNFCRLHNRASQKDRDYKEWNEGWAVKALGVFLLILAGLYFILAVTTLSPMRDFYIMAALNFGFAFVVSFIIKLFIERV